MLNLFYRSVAKSEMNLLAIKNRIDIYLKKGNERNVLAKRNIIASFGIKIIGIIISLILVPMTVNYVSSAQYGLWLTISSIVAWISYFDFGFAHGFRNRFTEAMALNDRELAKQYVSTTYAVLTIIFVTMAFVVLVINSFLDWSSLLNVGLEYGHELRLVFAVLTITLCLNMIASVLPTMLTAYQRPVYSSLFIVIGQIMSLIVIGILIRVTAGSLLYLAFALSVIPLLVLFVASFFVFSSKRYCDVAPSMNTINWALTKKIIGLGAQFFIIMVCMLFIFQVINIIIVRVCGPENVTAYNIAYKYFNILNMAMMIIVTPFWSACADAYTKKDFLWMKNVIEKMEMIWKLSICVLIIMILVSSTFYDIWVGDSVKISLSLSVMVGVYILVQNLCGIYIYMINGTSKIRLQLVVYLVSAFISVPTMYFLCSKYGITVMLLVPISVCLIQAFVAKKQLTKIIRGTASGIWIK